MIQQDFFSRDRSPCDVRSATPCLRDGGMFCRCREQDDAHIGRHVCLDCGSQILPSPPTGPAAEPYHQEDGTLDAFGRFRQSDNGLVFWEAILAAGLRALQNEEKRFSPRTYVAWYRDKYKMRINDHYSAWYADALIAADPRLEAIVERRKRKNRR